MSTQDLVRVGCILGRAADDPWRDRLAGASVDVLRLDQAQAQKSRLRKATEGGAEVALSLGRDVQISDGDVLYWNAAARSAVVARVDLDDVMIIDLSGLESGSARPAMATCVELGHALGNQHWPAVIKDSLVYVPVTTARAVMDSVMKTHALAGVRYEFTPGNEVIPYLAPHEARLLFGAFAAHRHDGPPGASARAPA